MSSVLDQKELTPGSLDELIVDGSTLAAIFHMSWPMLVQMLIISAASFADVYVAGKLGSETQAAIGICNQIWFLMVLLTVALSSGTMALVSRFWGARDYESAIEAGRQSLIFGFIFGTLSTLAGLAVAKPLLAITGTSPVVQDLSWHFLQIDLLSQLPFTIVWTCHSMFRAIGNSRAPMLIWLAMATVIISLDIGLCLGPLHLGINGIALSWCIAGCLGVALNFYLLRSSDLKASLNLGPAIKEGFSPRTREWIWRIMKVGLPTCIQDLAWVLGNFALFLIFAKTDYPTACQAAWTIGFRLEEMLCTLPLHALGASIGTIVGQNLGAKQPERAERTGWQAMVIGIALELPTAFALFFFAEPIARLMTSDPMVLASTANYLRIVGLSEPLVACWIVLFGALTGAGYTKWPMWIGIIGLTCVRLPLAYVLAFNYHMEATGIWLSIAISSSLIGLMAIQRFHSGVWKTQQV